MPDQKTCTINNRAFFLVGSICSYFIPLSIMMTSYGLTVQLLREQARFSGPMPFGSEGMMGRYRSVRRKAKPREPKPSQNVFSYENRIDMEMSENGSLGHDRIAMSNQDPQLQEALEQNRRNFKLKALRLQLFGSAAWHVRHFNAKRRNDLAANSVHTEQKASTVLGLVFFSFSFCWTPFFLLTMYMGLFPNYPVPGPLITMVLWLGYVSSCINPIIYTIFNKHFRSAFIKILLCRFSRKPSNTFYVPPIPVYRRETRTNRAPPPRDASSVLTLSSYVRTPSIPNPSAILCSSTMDPVVASSAATTAVDEHSF